MNIGDSNVVTDLNAAATPKSSTDAGFGSTTGPAASTALNNSKSKLLGMSRYYFWQWQHCRRGFGDTGCRPAKRPRGHELYECNPDTGGELFRESGLHGQP